MDKLVTAEWLNENLNRTDIVVLDCTVDTLQKDDGTTEYGSGRASYEQCHVPSAGFADLVEVMSDKTSPLMFALPAAEKFHTEIRRLGVHDDVKVILYDRSITAWAARIWWMLRWIGFDNVAILDGGFNGWIAGGFEISSEPPVERIGTLTLTLRPDVIVHWQEVVDSITKDECQLVDTLSPASFSGEENSYDRPGHIVGATNLFTLDIFDENGFFRSPDQLAAMFDGNPNQRHITYCGAGILASASAFAMVQAGYQDVAVYVASLQEWASDSSNPMQSGKP